MMLTPGCTLFASGLFTLQEEGSVCWLQRQKLSEDGSSSLQQGAALPLSVHWTLPVSNTTLVYGATVFKTSVKIEVLQLHTSMDE